MLTTLSFPSEKPPLVIVNTRNSYFCSVIVWKEKANPARENLLQQATVIVYGFVACLHVLNFDVIGQNTINIFLKYFRCSCFSDFDSKPLYSLPLKLVKGTQSAGMMHPCIRCHFLADLHIIRYTIHTVLTNYDKVIS